MFECSAVIQSMDPGGVHLRVDTPVACERCARGTGCGGGLLKPWSPSGPRILTYQIPQLPAGLKVGDHVVLRMSERRMLTLALLFYLLPIAVFLFTALLVETTTSLGEGYVVLSAIVALLACFPVVARLTRLRGDGFVPRVERAGVR